MEDVLKVEKVADLLRSGEEELFTLGVKIVWSNKNFTKIAKKLIDEDKWMGTTNTTWEKSVDCFVEEYNKEFYGRESEEHVNV